MMLQYYLYGNSLFFCVQVIRHYCNQGASSAGKESSHQRRFFPEEFFEFFGPEPLERHVSYY
jgi:hypothetical protein